MFGDVFAEVVVLVVDMGAGFDKCLLVVLFSASLDKPVVFDAPFVCPLEVGLTPATNFSSAFGAVFRASIFFSFPAVIPSFFTSPFEEISTNIFGIAPAITTLFYLASTLATID